MMHASHHPALRTLSLTSHKHCLVIISITYYKQQSCSQVISNRTSSDNEPVNQVLINEEAKNRIILLNCIIERGIQRKRRTSESERNEPKEREREREYMS